MEGHLERPRQPQIRSFCVTIIEEVETVETWSWGIWNVWARFADDAKRGWRLGIVSCQVSHLCHVHVQSMIEKQDIQEEGILTRIITFD